jgi:hypothetical protein
LYLKFHIEESTFIQRKPVAIKISGMIKISRNALSWKEVDIYSPALLTKLLQLMEAAS